MNDHQQLKYVCTNETNWLLFIGNIICILSVICIQQVCKLFLIQDQIITCGELLGKIEVPIWLFVKVTNLVIWNYLLNDRH